MAVLLKYVSTAWKSREIEMSALDYGTGLIGTTNLAYMLGIIERVEGYGEAGSGNGPGLLYTDSRSHPTIGYGFDLTQSNTMAAVLDGLLPAGQTYVAGGSNQNVFVVGAANSLANSQPVESAGAVAAYFSWIITQFTSPSGLIHNNLAGLQQDLTWALQQFYAGYGATLINGSGHGSVLPTSGNATVAGVSFSFPPTDGTNAEQVLSNLITGNGIPEGGAGSLSIDGYSPLLYGTFMRKNVPVAGGNFVGAQPQSEQWAALVAADYNGFRKPCGACYKPGSLRSVCSVPR
jgi:hypothetical protein